MSKKANIFIIGGAGFIGSHLTLLALEAGHHVSILNRSIPAVPDLFPETVTIHQGDANQIPEEKMEDMFRDHDCLIYAIGEDDRHFMDAPAYSYFYLHNVLNTARISRIAKKAGVKKMIILGSYFCHFNRIWPEMQLTRYHSYIRSRVEQEKLAIEYSSPEMEIIVLELPYIFGCCKGRIPLWKPLIDYILSALPLFYMQGGSNMISVKVVAKAVLGALYWGKGGEIYTIGDQNLSWSELLAKILVYVKTKKVIRIVPDSIIKATGALVDFIFFLRRKEMGLNIRLFMRVQTKQAFFDPVPAQKALHFTGGGLDDAIKDTIIGCYPEKTTLFSQ